MALPIIETPKYELTIPSTGQSVEYRPYLVKEEKILIIAMESQDTTQMIRAVRDVISACTFEKVNVDDLALFDLEFIFLKLRAASVGAESSVKVKCESCETQNPVIVKLDEVGIKGDLDRNKKIQLTDEVGVVLKFPTVKGALLQGGNMTDGYDSIMSTVIACIDMIYDKENMYDAADHTKEELVQFIESLSQEQFGKLNEFFNNIPGLDHTIEFDCHSCGHHNALHLRGLQSFF